MAKNITKYSVFIASPNDLKEERIEIESVIDELNISYGSIHNIVIDLLKWETHSAPGISYDYTQNLIGSDIDNDYDIFIGMLWQKFGTKTKNAESGTEEEFLNALARFRKKENIQILFYFKTATPKTLDEIDIEELTKIKNFKQKLIKEEILFWSFNNIDDLKTNLRLHIPKRIETIKGKSSDNSIQSLRKEEPVTINDESEVIILEEDYGLLDYAFTFENLMIASSNALNSISISTREMGDELNKKTDEITRISKQPNPSKSQTMDVLRRTSKVMTNYSKKLKSETPVFYDNFKEAINIGLKYMNLMNELDEANYIENLRTTLEATEELRDVLPNSVRSIKGMQEAVISLPRLQSDINSAKRDLHSTIQDLIDKLESAYSLTSEFVNQIEFKISSSGL